MTAETKADVHYDEAAGILTAFGIRCHVDIFRHIGVTPIGTHLKVIGRDDGVLTMSVTREPIEAAAPELLAALKGMIRICEAMRYTAGLSGRQITRIIEAKAIIEKVEGQS